MSFGLHLEHRLKRALVLAPLALLCASAIPAHAQDDVPSEPEYAFRLRKVGSAVGWAPLWTAANVSAGHREIRIWIGFGMFEPETATRIMFDGSAVRGSKVFWWETPTDAEAEADADRDSTRTSTREMYNGLRGTAGCGPRQRSGKYEWCTASLAPGQNWGTILKTLDSLGVAKLPDAASLSPPARTGLDGWSIVVEVREGPTYRSYSYWSPEDSAVQPEVRRAAAIAAVVDSIGKR